MDSIIFSNQKSDQSSYNVSLDVAPRSKNLGRQPKKNDETYLKDKDEEILDEKKINPYNFNNRFIKKSEIENILRRYGIFQTIHNLALYQQAFTHDSYCWDHANQIMNRDSVQIVDKPEGAIELQDASYQRLEFLGDRVINLIISLYLFQRYPGQKEGFLTKIYSKIVDCKGLARLARKVNFGQYLLVSRHLDEKNNARDKDNILEDSFEAFIGALFYDFNTKLNGFGYLTSSEFNSGPGFQICQKFILNLIEDEETGIDFVELISKDSNYKQMINTYFQKFNIKAKYQTTRNENIYIMENGQIIFGCEVEDPPTDFAFSDRIWWIQLKDTNGKIYADSVGRDKQQTEQLAARKALISLGRLETRQDHDFDDPELDKWLLVFNEKLNNGIIKPSLSSEYIESDYIESD
jgi:ribonuclease-3